MSLTPGCIIVLNAEPFIYVTVADLICPIKGVGQLIRTTGGDAVLARWGAAGDWTYLFITDQHYLDKLINQQEAL